MARKRIPVHQLYKDEGPNPRRVIRDRVKKITAHAPFGVSTIHLPGNYTFVGRNNKDGPNFARWWRDLKKRFPTELHHVNIELAHKAYLDGQSVELYAESLNWPRRTAFGKRDPKEMHAFEIVAEKKQLNIDVSCGVGPAVRTRIDARMHELDTELVRRRNLDSDALLREEAARRELDRRQKQPVEGYCDECGAGCVNPHEVSRHHLDTCSLYPDNVTPDPGAFRDLLERVPDRASLAGGPFDTSRAVDTMPSVSVASGTQVRPVSSTDPSAAAVVLTRAQLACAAALVETIEGALTKLRHLLSGN